MKKNRVLILFFSILLFVSCTDKAKEDNPEEDLKAKEMFRGLWVTEEDDVPALMAKGDSIFYPDSASMSVKFWIYQDSLFLKGQNKNSYKITKQSDNIFVFLNNNGEEVKLVKSKNKDLKASFGYQVYAMNTFLHDEADTTVRTSFGYFDSNIKVKTTSDRVIKSTFNENGMEVDNTYLDNVASVNITNHGTKIFAHDFKKQEFASLIDRKFLEKSILRRFEFNRADEMALYYDAIIGIPDASTSYVIEIRITNDGKTSMKMS